jgi:putative transposase
MDYLHKNIRLPHNVYVGKNRYFVTLCCANREQIFTTPEICNEFLTILRDDAITHFLSVHAYCLMPDHVHLLLEGLQPISDLLHFIKALKTKTSLQFARKTNQPIWQKKFYEHILRHNDAPDAVAWYIWMNPVRAGLCSQPTEHPFLGSFTGASPRAFAATPAWQPPWLLKPRLDQRVRVAG